MVLVIHVKRLITRFLLAESSAFQIKGKISVHERGLTPVQITHRNSGL